MGYTTLKNISVSYTYVYLNLSPEISIFEYTFCIHSVKFVAIAATKPFNSKLISFAEHKANPDITGNKLRLTYSPVCSPKN